MLFLMLTIACTSVGTSEQQESFLERISSTEKISTIDDFISIGFKVYKEYDVSELVRAESAWHGMWKDQTDRIDFEVRVYQTHFDAVEYGVPFADNVVGKDAVVKKSESIWPEGLKDRIKLASEGRNWGGVAGQKIVPKYLDYFIYGNVIILCEGLEPAESSLHCTNILKELVNE